MANQTIKLGGDGGTVRATISFPAEHYAELEQIAQKKKVSVAWIVRDAVEKYLTDQWPLLGVQDKTEGIK
ncbi:CopG family transcriptional regulator [Candidatus Thiothrix sp. Deng01]|uniref:CopG family transcriptional regulator n=1 Tax=Candidatus Thiothrix phosphatis TaxID=3112415 RepID=A0ABU6CXK3_9GAMM|nr:CopG family transcriptional regulator [Candidatus Thiothrix sp. Deng01]MEB4590812.1 CopG family transcriptional regulator [Candidatus Thiothrix sp. Deng01]